ncbi:MAG: TolC family protein [Myxococcaceae bacterium]
MNFPLVAAMVLLGQTPAPPASSDKLPPSNFSSRGLPDPMVPPKDAGLPMLTLDQALTEARTRNLDLKAAVAHYEAAKEIIWKTASGYLPQLSVQGSYTRNNIGASFAAPTGLYIRQGVPETQYYAPPPANLPGTVPTPALTVVPTYESIVVQEQNQWNGQIGGSQNILALSLIASIRASTLTARAAELNLDNTRRQILFGVAQQYYSAAGLRRAAEVQAELLEIQTFRENDAQSRFNAGSVNKIFLLSAQIGKTQAEQSLRASRYAYASSKAALAILLERSPDFEVDLPPDPQLPRDLEQLEDIAPATRPDVLSLKTQAEAAGATTTAVWLSYLPTIKFSGAYLITNATGFTGLQNSWYYTVGLNWTLLDGGLREASLREAQANERAAVASAESLDLQSKEQVHTAQLALESARANRTKAADQVKLAQENLALIKINTQAGAASYLEQQDAISSLDTAELTLIQETLNAQLGVLALENAAGIYDPQ